MKKIIIGASLLFFSCFARSQNGLENIIVEPYYISNAADAAASVGTLPVGSVTYRLYADMKPGYKFEALYGVPTTPPDTLHALILTTTTTFFNNEDRGATTPTYTKAQAKGNSIMLDSWFSVGAACAGQMGILKVDDSLTGTVVNVNGILQNNDPNAGIPIATRDGMIAGTPEQVTFVGFTTELNVFDGTSQAGNSFSTTNGSIAALNGAIGPDSTNRVLLGQFTTDGQFCYELNVQIGTPGGGVQNYVARNPHGNEISIPSLKGCISTTATGIPNLNSSKPSFNVFPNPSNNLISFEVDQSKQNNSYTIYSIEGAKIAHKELGIVTQKYTERFDLSSFPVGMYIVELSLDGNTSFQKVIKN